MPGNIPDGSGILLCPVGAEYGTISQDLWDTFQADMAAGNSVTQEISAEVFAVWFSNIKTATVRQQDSYDGEASPEAVEVVGQWEFDIGAETSSPNTGDHPLPRNMVGAGLMDIPLVSPNVDYRQADGTPRTLSHGPEAVLFIWQGRFYWFLDIIYSMDFVDFFEATMTADQVTITYEVGLTRQVFTIEATELFY